MSYSPVTGYDIRTSYDADNMRYVIQQERKRTANGTTNPNDLGSILDLNQVGWETRYETDDVIVMLAELFNIAYQDNVAIRSIDLGPVSPTSTTVVGAVTRLQLLTY